MKRLKIIITFIFIFSLSYCQVTDTIKVFFLYGSRPAPGYRNTEKHLFGGIHGGHVSIGIDSVIFGFNHVKGLHLFPTGKNFAGKFNCKNVRDFVKDTIDNKYTIFEVPLRKEQCDSLKLIIQNYLKETPYDYAFLGMRCAAASYDVLSQIGLFGLKSKHGNIFSNFYPKLLRKKMFELAREKKFSIITQQGKISRKWEKD
jgi:hypothetical protein